MALPEFEPTVNTDQPTVPDERPNEPQSAIDNIMPEEDLVSGAPARFVVPKLILAVTQKKYRLEGLALKWQEDAACQNMDPNIFFSKDEVGIEVAKAICRSCIVQSECLEYALDTRADGGVWGGASERERRQILKRRKGRKDSSA
jgi:WhiB family transcriptional regulator, redox-sensing transcriptional regulator